MGVHSIRATTRLSFRRLVESMLKILPFALVQRRGCIAPARLAVLAVPWGDRGLKRWQCLYKSVFKNSILDVFINDFLSINDNGLL